MNKYFNTEIYNPDYKPIKVDSLLQENMSLIIGDFWGIQNFIFDGLTTKNAAKILRSKSAFVQIYTEVLSKYICYVLKIDEKYIISYNAGKFEILVPFQNLDLSDIQSKVDEYFKKYFYGLSGVVLTKVEFKKEKWKYEYKKFREEIGLAVENTKFKKFNLLSTNPVLEYDVGINNQNLCKICNMRKIEKDNCSICNIFIALGKKLTQNKQQNIFSDEIGIFFDNWKVEITLDKRLKSYIPQKDDEPLTFENIAKNSCHGLEKGIKALGILKADVDSMGNFIKNSDITDNFENFDKFSKGLDGFFSIYIPQILREKYRNIYTVFAGGDDLFLIGAWDEIMEFSRFIQKTFKQYVNSKKTKLSISFGIAIAKPSTPVSYLANHTEELLEISKEVDNKDAITIWSESVKWNNYIEVFNELREVFIEYENLETTTIYRFLEFCNMSKKVVNGDIKATIWKSKLNYLFSRNMDLEKDKKLMEVLSENIEKNSGETKIFLSEFTYKRRKS